ncbi:hypothetical protein KEG38_04410 [Polyangium jinanense]|uniref:hypothetical protein n=1 Tax=Polyangium jinanense TaxID=2829994 RepID=UPI002342122E|nr:hypothetical protein [Polyangium jinanense]MDC3953072.1 hypothetical protein [Polyangium jinanense]
MKLTAEQQALVREELSRYLESTDSRKMVADLVDVAREASALPVYADMGGALLITMEGDVEVPGTYPRVTHEEYLRRREQFLERCTHEGSRSTR